MAPCCGLRPYDSHIRHILALWLFLAISPLSVSALPRSSPEDKYYRATSVDFGSFAIVRAHVRLVAIPRTTDPDDNVHILTLDKGIVRIKANGAANSRTGTSNTIEADVADGTDDDPPALLRGTFRWEKGKLIAAHLDSVRFRLRSPNSTIPLGGGKLVPSRSRLLFVDNRGPVEFAGGQSKGVLRLIPVGATIEGAQIKIQNVAVNTNFKSKSNAPPEFEVDLASGNVTPTKANFYTELTTLAQPAAISFFKGEIVSSTSVSIRNLSLDLTNAEAHMRIGTISLEKPSVRIEGHQELPVVAAKSYVAHNVTSDSPVNQLAFTNLHSTTAFAKPDPWELANQLNGAGVFAPDVLLPVANSDLRYIKLSDLMFLYKKLAIDDPSKTSLTRVVIQQDNGVVTKITIDTMPAKAPKDAVQIEHPICVFVGVVSGVAAGAAVDAVLVEFPVAAGVSVWLETTSPINPWIAGPSFLGTYAVSRGAVNLVGKGFTGFDGLAAGVAGHLTSDYCEVMIAHMPNRYVIGRPDYVFHPVVFEGLSVSPDRLLEDEISIRYQLYLGQAIKTSRIEHDPLYRGLKATMQSKNATLTQIRSVTIDARDASLQRQNDYANHWTAVEEARQTEIENRESANLNTSLDVKQAGEQARAEEARQREAQKRVTPGPSGQPQVPGTPPQPPPPTGGTGSSPTPGNRPCGDAPNCISTKPK